MIKVAFLSMYYRLTEHNGSNYSKNWVRTALHWFSAYIAVGFVLSIGMHTFWCFPIKKNCTSHGFLCRQQR